MGNYLVAGIPGVEIQHFDELSTTIRQLIYSFAHALLLLGLNPNLFNTVPRVCRFIEFVIGTAFAMLLGPDMDALPRGCGDQP
jgi:hypothetical protein